MMQRWCWRLRSLAALGSSTQPHRHRHHHHLRSFSAASLLHTSPNSFHKPPITNRSLIAPNFSPHISASAFPSAISHSPLSLIQVRHVTGKRRMKSRRPTSPIVSKVKKIKIKGYSSFKGRFRLMHDGEIRRWKEGKKHNAFAKSKKSKRRLRQPGTVPLAYAKVMKRLNFCN